MARQTQVLNYIMGIVMVELDSMMESKNSPGARLNANAALHEHAEGLRELKRLSSNFDVDSQECVNQLGATVP